MCLQEPGRSEQGRGVVAGGVLYRHAPRRAATQRDRHPRQTAILPDAIQRFHQRYAHVVSFLLMFTLICGENC